MQERHIMFDCHGGYHAVYSVADCDTSPSQGAVQLSRIHESSLMHGEEQKGVKPGCHGLVVSVFPYALQDLGQDDTTDADVFAGIQHMLECLGLRGVFVQEEVDPDRCVNEGHGKHRTFRHAFQSPRQEIRPFNSSTVFCRSCRRSSCKA